MQIPRVAIIGRPNVGKSSLFNALIGRRISIVEPTSGVTRDRISFPVEFGDRWAELFDTGGIGIDDMARLSAQIEEQISRAIQEADVLLFVVDAQAGVAPLDKHVAEIVRKTAKPYILIANKVDDRVHEALGAEFFELGLGEPALVSAARNRGIRDVAAAVAALLPADKIVTEKPAEGLKVAIVGKRNVGKSTLINSLLREERLIVSDVPGTTRDSVDVRFEHKGKVYTAIDTAGLRKRGKLDTAIEFFGVHRAERTIRRCDVAIFVLEATVDITEVDKRICKYIVDEYKPCVIAVNKWDLAQGMKTQDYQQYLESRLVGLHFAPLIFVSAKERTNLWSIISVAESLHEQAGKDIGTGRLNSALQKAIAKRATYSKSGREGKIFYAAQVGAHPPNIIVFVNDPKLFSEEYRRYLMNSLRESLGVEEVPVRLMLRRRPGRHADEGRKKH